MKTTLFIFFFIILTWSCQRAEIDLGIAGNYLPKAEHLDKGVVNKYYEHYNPGPNTDIITNIYYESYESTRSNEIRINRFNAGFELDRSRIFSFEDNQMLLTSELNVVDYDTVQTEIIKPLYLSWDGFVGSGFEKMIGDNRVLTQQQIKVDDTTVLGRPSKIFYKTIILAEKSIYDTSALQLLYVQGFGLYSLKFKQADLTNTIELVEQMSLEKFTQLREHGRHRVGHINPEEVIDQNSSFGLCDDHRKVYDYYNGSPRVEFSEKKRAMIDILFSKIDPEKLFDESGFLTFRFIVNCKGQAGWFVTEQADLNYQVKQFPEDTVDHLYSIIAELKTWSPSVIDQEPRDAYFYITFRMKNGKILDILP